MNYYIETWTIYDFIEKYEDKKLHLNPPYQRKFIWSLSDQQILIESIIRGFAIPNIFLYKKSEVYEMVDGQQRTRTIVNFYNKGFKTSEGSYYSKEAFPSFLSYAIPVTVITKIEKDESIEEFYALVNKAGIHLNRPELKRAEYFDTTFLKLVNELAGLKEFQDLKLFSDFSEKRMIDVDFVSELSTQMIDGITDKKNSVDKIFENDISKDEQKKLKKEFKEVLKIISALNDFYPVKKTRYRQRNDFYTLFGFVHRNIKLTQKNLLEFYKLLVKFNDDINPSNVKCEPFQEYAFNCVSQSNSKAAREKRLEIFNDLFLNDNDKPNPVQKKVMKCYNLNDNDMIKLGEYFTFNIKRFQS